MNKHSASLRTACRLFNISKQGYHYKAKNAGDHYKTILKDLAYQQPEVLPHPSQDLPGAHPGHGVHSQVPSNDAISKTNSCEEISVVAEVHDIPNDVSISSIEGFIPEVSIDLNIQALTSQQM